jgi:hypothetical protein
MKKVFLGGVLAVALWCNGCAPKADSPSASSSPSSAGTGVPASPNAVAPPGAGESVSFSEEVKAQAASLQPQLQDSSALYKVTGVKENGPAFVYLASTSEDPKIAAAAFQGMSETYTTYEKSTDKNQVDAAYLAALRKGLASTDKPTLYWALKAAATTQRDDAQDAEITKILNDIARNHAELGARYEALQALSTGSRWQQNEETAETFLQALSKEPLLASLALFRWDGKAGFSSKKEQLHAAILPLLEHADPGVRGRALLVVTETVPADQKSELAGKLEAMLQDQHAYVRSMAAKSLADMRHLSSAARLMPLLDDKANNTYDITYDTLLGQSGTAHHDGGPWSRVDDSTLIALHLMSNQLPEGKRLEYPKINSGSVDADIATEVEKTRAWFKANEQELASKKS